MTFVSALSHSATRYPNSDESFSPSEGHPEYRLGAIARAPNAAYAQVRALFAQARLDEGRLGTAAWNPLGDLVPTGARVFVLCNFVYHRRPGESELDFHGKCIHGSVLRALIDYLLIAVGSAGSVRFGNAPLQSCDWEAVQRETGADRVSRFYAERGLPVTARDLRLLVTQRGSAGGMRRLENRDASGAAVEVELGANSLLSGLPSAPAGTSNFRVADYDASRTEAYHREGIHRYVIHRDVLESDVVVNLSKLKTHEKVGITCGLKGYVGAVGHKDCLAHHRYGSPRIGGDEYPAQFAFLHSMSALHEWVYRRAPDAFLQNLAVAGDRILRTAVRRFGAVTTGAWHGNDTAWRMALDLARILRYADVSGSLRDVPQRRHLSLIDGIVAGEGEGPLAPRGLEVGTLIFGDDVPVADRIACRLMGFEPASIPLVREAFAQSSHPISDCPAGVPVVCRVNGSDVIETDLKPAAGRPFAAPRGWRERLAID